MLAIVSSEVSFIGRKGNSINTSQGTLAAAHGSPRWGHYGIVVSCRVALWVLGSRASTHAALAYGHQVVPCIFSTELRERSTFGRSTRFWCVSEREGWCFTLWPTMVSLWHGLFWEQLLRSEQIEALCEHPSLISHLHPHAWPESDQPLAQTPRSDRTTQSWA